MSRAMALVLLLALPGLALAGPRPPRLHSDGTWLRDDAGRVVLLRGINYSGLEFGNFIGRPRGPEAADFEQMASWGVNVVRLPIAWHYLEPAPGVFDQQHLRTQVDPILRWAKRNGIGVVLEFHQFQWSPCTGGNGVPAWSCEGRYPSSPLGAFQAQHDFWDGATAPDGRTLIDHLLDVWARVARRYRSSRALVGIDFLNEPIDLQAIATFEHDSLYPFYRRAVATVRGVGARQVIVLEPPVTRNLGIAAKPEPVGDDNLLWAPHLYTITGGLPEVPYNGNRAAVVADYALAATEAVTQGAVLWAGEYGGNTDDFRAATSLFLRHSLEVQDAQLVGGAAWAYFPSGNTFSLVTADGREKGDLVDVFSRPYPAQTAGIPQALSWNQDTRVFEYTFAEDPTATVRDPTIIFVPAARHYPGGFSVETSAGVRTEFDAESSRLRVWRDPAEGVHEVRLRPATP